MDFSLEGLSNVFNPLQGVTDKVLDSVGAPDWLGNALSGDPSRSLDPFGHINDYLEGASVEIERLSGLNAQFIQMEANENKRRATLQHEDLVNQVIGIQASSGFLANKGTNVDYVAKMESSFQSELDYMDKSTASQIEITLLEGKVEADISKDAAKSGMLGTGMSIVGMFGGIG